MEALTEYEIKRRYFREPLRDDSLRTRFKSKFGCLFGRNAGNKNRRESFLTDTNYSVDLDELERAKNARIKENKPSFLSSIVNDWSFLCVLGVSMSFGATLIDEFVKRLGDIHMFTLKVLDSVDPNEDGIVHDLCEFFIWVFYAVVLTMLSATSVRIISAEAIGSGVPEMKSVLRGSVLENYLTLRTLVSVFCGLTLAMGSGMPIGKAGPFIHASSIMANLIGQLVFSFDPHAEVTNSKQAELLAVGCAVGTSCVFSSPIGGVLFAIEVTSAYFSVKNYWRSFFAAVVATIVSRLIRVALQLDISVGALFPTSFPDENAFFPEELMFFAILGVICGFLSIAFIVLHRKIVLCRRNNAIVRRFFNFHWSLYPICVSLIVSAITYPEWLGNFIGGERKFGSTIRDFFANCTWAAKENATNFCSDELREIWLDNGNLNPYLVLFCFVSIYLLLSGLAATLPIPNGASGAAFVIGAGVGRLIGELVSRSFPDGIRNDHSQFVYPGLYSVVGAASLCGGFTHTVSPAIMAFEMTGQLVAILPVLIAVLISTAICSFFQPSFYESLIQLKNLPYLPDIPPSSNCHGIVVQQFMSKNEAQLTPKSTYADARKILDEEAHIKVIPVVENLKTKLLIGTVHRRNLQHIINQLISPDKRRFEAEKRMRILNKVFGCKAKQPLLHPHTQPNLANGSTGSMLKNTRNANSNNDIDSIGRFTVTKCRGWTIVRQAIDDKRIHQIALNEEYYQQQEQTGTKKKTLKDIAKKIADVSNKLSQALDLYGENRDLWEKEQLSDIIDLKASEIDSAPFRLIVNTSLLNVYSLFSLLCLNRAYVTNHGKLVGVVTLAEIQKALEDVQNGHLFPLPKRPTEDKDTFDHFRRSLRRLARRSIVQFMEADENPWINKKWSQDIAQGVEAKLD